MLENYHDEFSFRLFHNLKSVQTADLDGFSAETVKKDQLQIMESVINRSYSDLKADIPLLESYTKTAVYKPELWIFIRETITGAIVGSGIADYDPEARELTLEWIQVLPEYRREKLGQLIVNNYSSAVVPTPDLPPFPAKFITLPNQKPFTGNAVFSVTMFGIF